MAENKVLDLAPLITPMTKDANMLEELFNDLQKLEWTFYTKDEHTITLLKCCSALGVEYKEPTNINEFAKLIGTCEKIVLEKIKQARVDMTDFITKLTSDSLDEFFKDKGGTESKDTVIG